MAEINKQYIENRVHDWVNRLNSLYTFIENSLSNNKHIAFKRNRLMIMNEEMMHKYDVRPEKISLLDIYKDNKIVATLKPIGLWVIGANGRVDILTDSGAYIVVDIARNDQEEPYWQVYTPKNRKKSSHLDLSFITDLVSNA